MKTLEKINKKSAETIGIDIVKKDALKTVHQIGKKWFKDLTDGKLKNA